MKRIARDAARASGGLFRRAVKIAGMFALAAVGTIVVLYLVATAINGFARWNARRIADRDGDPTVIARNNLLVIGAEKEGQAEGFLAIRADERESQIFALAIPDAAFMEIPGQGFDRAGSSYADGPHVSAAAISNFLSVTFDQWVVVEAEAYRSALQNQDLTSVLDTLVETNMSEEELEYFDVTFSEVESGSVAIAPLPVRPISLGAETYFEPQREEIADLLLSWWGVSLGSGDDQIRVIVYNGSGIPGIAGTAAQELIRHGFRVVETRNADNFDYEDTLVFLYHGDEADAELVRDTLGTGRISRQRASQEVADVIVIIGKDYSPPEQDG